MTNETSELTTGVTWVVVAAAERAEIFSREKRFSPLESVQSFEEPRARSKESELASDAPGRSFDSGGEGRHFMEPGRTGKQHLRQEFAHRVAQAIESARNANRFQRLVIVAAPAFLGELRGQLSDATRSRVAAEIAKHMTDQEPAAIAELIDRES